MRLYRAGSFYPCHGLEVLDLGVDVPAERLVSEANRLKPGVIGISALITSVFGNLKHTIERLRADPGLKPLGIPIVIGGAQVDSTVCRATGADDWANDAMRGVEICLRHLG